MAAYHYNALGQRTRKKMASGTTVYHYDTQGKLIAETTATGALIRDYIWLEDMPVAQIDAGPSETITYLHPDHLSTPRRGTDTTGQLVWYWEGDAFGSDTPMANMTVNLRFAGQYYDNETGLHRKRGR